MNLRPGEVKQFVQRFTNSKRVFKRWTALSPEQQQQQTFLRDLQKSQFEFPRIEVSGGRESKTSTAVPGCLFRIPPAPSFYSCKGSEETQGQEDHHFPRGGAGKHFCKDLDSRRFRVCRPFGLCRNYPALPIKLENHRRCRRDEGALSQKHSRQVRAGSALRWRVC